VVRQRGLQPGKRDRLHLSAPTGIEISAVFRRPSASTNLSTALIGGGGLLDPLEAFEEPHRFG
jgi:hypothetical protein